MISRPKRSTFRNRYEEMVTTLRNEIINKIWREDSYLPSEIELAARFDLSKNSIRKGLDVLVQEGMIEKVPRIGNRICYASGAIPIKFGYYPSLMSEAGLEQLVAHFHAVQPDIRVQLLPMPFVPYNPFMKDYMQSEQMDVISINNQNFGLFIEPSGKPELLEPLAVNPGVYRLLNEPFMHDDTLYVQPFLFSPVILCYNKDHFHNRKVPEPDSSWTWDDMKAAARKLTEGTDRYGFLFHLLSDNRWPIFLLQEGIRFERDANNNLVMDEKLLENSFNLLSELRTQIFPPFLSESDQDIDQLFAQQKVSMILTSYFYLNRLRDVPFNYDIAPLPYAGQPKTLTIVIGLAINKQSERQEAARTFVDFMVSHDAQLLIRQHTTSIPSLKSAAEWQGPIHISLPERYFIFRETFPTFRFFSDLNVSYEELREIRQLMKLYLSVAGGQQ